MKRFTPLNSALKKLIKFLIVVGSRGNNAHRLTMARFVPIGAGNAKSKYRQSASKSFFHFHSCFLSLSFRAQRPVSNRMSLNGDKTIERLPHKAKAFVVRGKNKA